jgi:hypothetical protein
MLISQALIGNLYRSHSLARKGQEGIIQFAERRSQCDKHFTNSENTEYAYLITVRPENSNKDFHATMWVGVDND